MLDSIAVAFGLASLLIGGVLLHEATHAAVGWWSGTLVEAGTVHPDRDGWRRYWLSGLYVRESRPNVWSTFAPLVWSIPLLAVEVAWRLGWIGDTAYLLVFVPSLVAAVGVLLSDFPLWLGIVDGFTTDRYRHVPWVRFEVVE